MKKFCPLLTAASLANGGGSRIATPSSPQGFKAGAPKKTEFEGITCSPSCALFSPIADVEGKVIDGACSLMLIPSALGMMNLTHREGYGLDEETVDEETAPEKVQLKPVPTETDNGPEVA